MTITSQRPDIERTIHPAIRLAEAADRLVTAAATGDASFAAAAVAAGTAAWLRREAEAAARIGRLYERLAIDNRAQDALTVADAVLEATTCQLVLVTDPQQGSAGQ